jgi:uncharacterized protein
MTRDKQQQLARAFLSVLRTPDADVIRRVAVEDIVWSFLGSMSISGIARGVDGVIGRAQTIAAYGVKVETMRAVFGHDGVALMLYNTAERGGHVLTSLSLPSSPSAATGLPGSIHTYPTFRWQKPFSAECPFPDVADNSFKRGANP